MASHLGTEGVLPGHEDDPQRAAGKPGGLDDRTRDLRGLQPAQRRGARRTSTTSSSSTTHSRRRWSSTSVSAARALDLALPHRPLGANPTVWEFLARASQRYDAAISTMPEYVPTSRPADRATSGRRHRPARAEEHGALARTPSYTRPVRHRRRPPAADQVPASTRGRTRSASSTRTALVREERPDVQLALVGSMAHDDPEGWDFYNQTRRATPAATPTSTSSRTSTTSARSR